MSLLITSLYFLCCLWLAGLAVFIFAQNPRSWLHGSFVLGTLALLGWLSTLFVFNRQTDPKLLTELGRLNFVTALFAVFFAYLFVAELTGRRVEHVRLLWIEVIFLTLLTLLSPAIDRSEAVQESEHVTHFGLLFPLYITHIAGYLTAALRTAFGHIGSLRTPRRLRHQLLVISLGLLATAAIAMITNVVLPYAFHVFALQDVGTLSTILFLAAVGYAVFAYHLFNVRVIIRATFVFAGLIALALELYQLALSFLAHLLPLGDATERHYAAVGIVLVVNAWTQEPLRRWLEHVIDPVVSHRKPADRTHAERHYLAR